MRFILSTLKWSVITLAVFFTITATWLYFSTYHPGDIEVEEITTISEGARKLSPSQKVKLMSWNVQFMAGNENNNFFFDGGQDPWPSIETINQITAQAAEIIIQENPDFIFLQEVDEGAARTGHRDQLQDLLDLLPDHYSHHTSSFYWLADYIPGAEIGGSVGMKLSIISKYPLKNARRYALAAITSDDIILRQFNAKRAVLGVAVPLAGGGQLQLLNTHLSAFSYGTDTMEKQVTRVKELITDFDKRGEAVLLAGDFNLIPSKAAYDALSQRNRKYYNADYNELDMLTAHYASVPSIAETLSDTKQHWYTHSPNHNNSQVPNKTIDYIFYTKNLGLEDHYVLLKNTKMISDHMPVMAEFMLSAE